MSELLKKVQESDLERETKIRPDMQQVQRCYKEMEGDLQSLEGRIREMSTKQCSNFQRNKRELERIHADETKELIVFDWRELV